MTEALSSSRGEMKPPGSSSSSPAAPRRSSSSCPPLDPRTPSDPPRSWAGPAHRHQGPSGTLSSASAGFSVSFSPNERTFCGTRTVALKTRRETEATLNENQNENHTETRNGCRLIPEQFHLQKKKKIKKHLLIWIRASWSSSGSRRRRWCKTQESRWEI